MTKDTIKVVDPAHPMYGKTLIVEMTRPNTIYAASEGGHVWTFAKHQVEVTHMHDWDQFLIIAGTIPDSRWNQIRKELEQSTPEIVAISGWTGKKGYMTLKFDLHTASQHLAAVNQVLAPFGLAAHKDIPELS